jgi:hypothetical protein
VAFEILTVDALELPDHPLALPEPRIWTANMPVAFIGEIETPPKTTGTIVRIEIRRILPDGSLDRPRTKQVVARLLKRGGNLPYLVNWHAPEEPGRYRVTLRTIGPNFDLANLDTFAEGEVEVKRGEEPRTQ